LTLIIISTTKTFGQPLNDSVVDIDGNVYHTIKIGTRIWMMENLKVTHYRNGDAIPNVIDNKQWIELQTGAYCFYNNDTNRIRLFGMLYNWFAVNDSRNIAPQGYHVATFDDWYDLIKHHGADSLEIKKPIKNVIIKDTTDLYLVPGGYRAYEGFYLNRNQNGFWWLPPSKLGEIACCGIFGSMRFDFKNLLFDSEPWLQFWGMSILCVKD